MKEDGILVSEKPTQLSSVPISSMTNLTFEQQKELLMMQHEKFIQQRELEVELMKQKTEQEVMKQKTEQEKLKRAM